MFSYMANMGTVMLMDCKNTNPWKPADLYKMVFFEDPNYNLDSRSHPTDIVICGLGWLLPLIHL